MKIVKIDRYGTYSEDYTHFVFYENGDIDQYGSYNTLPLIAKRFMAKADFQFMKSKTGEYFHRFS